MLNKFILLWKGVGYEHQSLRIFSYLDLVGSERAHDRTTGVSLHYKHILREEEFLKAGVYVDQRKSNIRRFAVLQLHCSFIKFKNNFIKFKKEQCQKVEITSTILAKLM
jgi:hypothetical protein